MSAIPAGVDAKAGPPLSIPLQHFLVALGFLVAAIGPGIAARAGIDGLATTATLHLLLLGWVCVTIMGAMTQFVPVWSGVDLHSRRLSRVALALAAPGIATLAAGLTAGRFGIVAIGGTLAVVGIWTFVYNLGRTLAVARPWDVTETHFALALAAFVAATGLGLSLGISLATGRFPSWIEYAGVRGAHVTLAVFGAVLVTVAGALYQLATMFTATELDRPDRALQRVESVALPTGVAALTGGHLVGSEPAATVGGTLVLLGIASVTAVLAHRLLDASVEFTPMHWRYVVAAVALAGWVAYVAPAWLTGGALDAPLGPEAAPELLVAAVAFVVAGTLYHVIPFVVWFHRYSDRIGLEDVPMIDDLYDDRLAALDGTLLVLGAAGIVAGTAFGAGTVRTAGGAVAAAGALVFATNVALVVHEHGPGGVKGAFQGGGRAGGSGD